ncbi:MAG: hypothetical protein KAX44_07765, partial [Candidatus Brocadiae bacterium]|nr:hypothetical protein [Candidatus Brocadiia bacterium]
EYVLYVDADDNTVPCYARWDNRNDDTGDPLITRNYPNLSSFQLYSWGPDLQPGCAPTTGAAGSRPNFRQPGVQPGWTAASRNLTSWQE